MMKFRRRMTGLAIVTVVAVGSAIALHAPAGARTLTRFAPDRVARLEVAMWQAYYGKQRLRLFSLLVTTLREQYGYSWARATQASLYLARAATRFGDMRGDYDTVLPDLQAAYTIARDWTDASFDPAAVARAELAWWVARRTPGQSHVANVGRLIGEEYALLYGVRFVDVAHAAELRAKAGHLRDEGGAHADWPAIERLLIESYRELKSATTGQFP